MLFASKNYRCVFIGKRKTQAGKFVRAKPKCCNVRIANV
jgi:hypothetical protein